MKAFKSLEEAEEFLRREYGEGELWESGPNYAYFIFTKDATMFSAPPIYSLGKKKLYVFKTGSDWRPSPASGWNPPSDPARSKRGRRKR